MAYKEHSDGSGFTFTLDAPPATPTFAEGATGQPVSARDAQGLRVGAIKRVELMDGSVKVAVIGATLIASDPRTLRDLRDELNNAIEWIEARNG